MPMIRQAVAESSAKALLERSLLLLWLILVAPSSLPAQQDPQVQALAGCYVLQWQPWQLDSTEADSAWQTPSIEHRVWLTLTPVESRDPADWYVVRPAPGALASEFADVRWSSLPGSGDLVIEWDAAMSGVRLKLTPMRTSATTIDSLAGSAHQWSHDSEVPKHLRAIVGAARQVCALQD